MRLAVTVHWRTQTVQNIVMLTHHFVSERALSATLLVALSLSPLQAIAQSAPAAATTSASTALTASTEVTTTNAAAAATTSPSEVSGTTVAAATTAPTQATAPTEATATTTAATTDPTGMGGLTPTQMAVLASLGMTAMIGAVGLPAWWWGKPRVKPWIRDTGWFGGPKAYAGGSDKVGHMYTHYIMTLTLADAYMLGGMEALDAALLSSTVAFLLGNGVEAADAITNFGFEYGDVVFNTLGIALAGVAVAYPTVHSLVGMRWAWLPSEAFLQREVNYLTFVNDYSGMIVYGDLKIKGVLEQLGIGHDGPANYLLTGVSWSTTDYSPIPVGRKRVKRRMLGMHVGLSVAEVLEDVLEPTFTNKLIKSVFRYYALPFTNLEFVRDFDNNDWFMRFGANARWEFNP